MKKLFIVLLAVGCFFAVPAFAQLNPESLKQDELQNAFSKTFDTPAAGSDLEQTLPAQIGRLIQLFVSFAGVVMLVIIVYAGILWMTAGGGTERIEQAKKLMQNAIIGLIIVLLAYVIVTFINGLIIGAGFGQS